MPITNYTPVRQTTAVTPYARPSYLPYDMTGSVAFPPEFKIHSLSILRPTESEDSAGGRAVGSPIVVIYPSILCLAQCTGTQDGDDSDTRMTEVENYIFHCDGADVQKATDSFPNGARTGDLIQFDNRAFYLKSIVDKNNLGVYVQITAVEIP